MRSLRGHGFGLSVLLTRGATDVRSWVSEVMDRVARQ